MVILRHLVVFAAPLLTVVKAIPRPQASGAAIDCSADCSNAAATVQICNEAPLSQRDTCLCGGGGTIQPALNCIECGGNGRFNTTALTQLGQAMQKCGQLLTTSVSIPTPTVAPSGGLNNPFNINVKNDCTDVQALVEICTDDPVDQRTNCYCNNGSDGYFGRISNCIALGGGGIFNEDGLMALNRTLTTCAARMTTTVDPISIVATPTAGTGSNPFYPNCHNDCADVQAALQVCRSTQPSDQQENCICNGGMYLGRMANCIACSLAHPVLDALTVASLNQTLYGCQAVLTTTFMTAPEAIATAPAGQSSKGSSGSSSSSSSDNSKSSTGAAGKVSVAGSMAMLTLFGGSALIMF